MDGRMDGTNFNNHAWSIVSVYAKLSTLICRLSVRIYLGTYNTLGVSPYCNVSLSGATITRILVSERYV